MQINDPAFGLGEKVRPKKAEPAPCPYAAFERTAYAFPETKRRSWAEEKAHIYDDCSDAVHDFIMKLRGGCGCCHPPHRAPCLNCETPWDDVEVEQYMEDLLGMERPAVKKSLPIADPGGWIPHVGGPCPVDGEVLVDVKTKQCPAGYDLPDDAKFWNWNFVTAYKLATPPEAPKEAAPYPTAFLDMVISEYGPYDLGEYVRSRGDCSCHIFPPCFLCSSPIEYADAEGWLGREPQLHPLHQQQLNQYLGLPVEWDKVPVGSKVWVRDGNDLKWVAQGWSKLSPGLFGAYRANGCSWAQCKLHIEGVEP
jgi:hypothetical protein